MRRRTPMACAGGFVLALCLGFASSALAGPIGECGGGTVDPLELCDDGNTVDGDGCSTSCISEICGDGVLENNGAAPDEECDDGNTTDGDGCEGDCTCGPCGDGIVCFFDEECDDGNTNDFDLCSSDCTFIDFCGNGIVEATEECDDGNTIDTDGCGNDCTLVPPADYAPTRDELKCVNGINKSWAGVIKATNEVSRKCVKDISGGKVTGTFVDCAVAGDVGKPFEKTTKSDEKSCAGKVSAEMFGYVGDPTAVNEGALTNTLTAHSDLLGTASNIVPKAEKDAAKCQQEVQKGLIKYLDGLAADANKAKKACLKGKKVAQCQTAIALGAAMTGDGKKGPKALSSWNTKVGKKCSDTTMIAAHFPGACAASATYASLVTCSSQRARCALCSSLNAADGLAIDCAAYSGDPAECGFEVTTGCPDGEIQGTEECDDGNTIAGDGCEPDCTLTFFPPPCGNGVLEGGEECDDGNDVDGDGCDSTCTVPATCGNGFIEGSEGCDDGNTVDGDGCTSTCLLE